MRPGGSTYPVGLFGKARDGSTAATGSLTFHCRRESLGDAAHDFRCFLFIEVVQSLAGDVTGGLCYARPRLSEGSAFRQRRRRIGMNLAVGMWIFLAGGVMLPDVGDQAPPRRRRLATSPRLRALPTWPSRTTAQPVCRRAWGRESIRAGILGRHIRPATCRWAMGDMEAMGPMGVTLVPTLLMAYRLCARYPCRQPKRVAG